MFPTLEEHGFNQGQPGLTLRDYLATKAMEALMNHAHMLDLHEEDIANAAYRQADEMLTARDAK